jgi:hypothetical protein
MTQAATLTLLRQIAEDYESNPAHMYDESIALLQYAAVQKNMEFDGYFRTNWEIEEDHPMTFDDEYFENENRSELYVYLAADASEEIYEGLQFAYNLTHQQKLSKEILHQEISSLREQGVTF